MVIDELIVRENGIDKSIDSADNKPIDIIHVEDSDYHFAKEKQVVGLTSVTAGNAVNEPLIDMQVSGNSVQNGTPTPETPIEIESVGERTKNLFNKETAELGKNLNANTGTLYNSSVRCVSDYIEVDATKQYTFVYNATLNSASRYSCCYDANKNHLGANNVAYSVIAGDSFTIMTVKFILSDVKYIRANCFWNEDGSASEIDSFMIFEGEYNQNEMPSYEPYGYKVPVKVSGKNLFDIKTAETVFRNGTVQETKTENGYTLTNSATTANFIIVKFGNTNDWLGKTLMLSCDISDGGVAQWVYFDENGGNRTSKGSTTITVDNTNVCFGLRLNASTTDKNMVFDYSNIQIEEGSTATAYESYIEAVTTNIYLKEPLRKVGE